MREQPSAGFTLIEVLIVLTLIVVLAGMGLATYTTSITGSTITQPICRRSCSMGT